MSWPKFLLAISVLAAIPLAVEAATVDNRPINNQLWRVTARDTSTQSTEWVDVSGLSNQLLCARNGMSATIAVDLEGASEGVKFRLVVDGKVARPRAAFFDTGTIPSDRNSFSFTFVKSISRGSHTLDVQWKSPSGNQVTLHTGILQVLYKDLDGCG